MRLFFNQTFKGANRSSVCPLYIIHDNINFVNRLGGSADIFILGVDKTIGLMYTINTRGVPRTVSPMCYKLQKTTALFGIWAVVFLSALLFTRDRICKGDNASQHSDKHE